jgi:VWFA-related protein
MLAVLCAGLCCAQSTPEVSSQETPVTFSSRVNLVSVPVVVRDREGRALGKLKQEDFQLFDKNKLQVITKFSIEQSGSEMTQPAPSAGAGEQTQATPVKSVLPDRYVAYLVDDVHLLSSDLLQMRQSMNRHLDESQDPTTRSAIFVASGRMLTEFTADREKLHRAINSIQPWTSGPDPQQDCPHMTYYTADLLVNKLLYLDGILFTDDQLSVLYSHNQLDHAMVAEIADTQLCGVESVGSKNMATGVADPIVDVIRQVRKEARLVLTYGDRETNLTLGAIEDVVSRISAVPGSRTIVLVSPGFLLTRDHRSHEYAALDRAIRANVTVNTLDIRGLYTSFAGGDASHRVEAAGESSAAFLADDVLAEVADGTGGKFFHNSNDLQAGLNQLAARPEYVYVLGFSPDNLKFDGSYHTLKVSVRNASGATLQVRRGYWAPNHAVDPAEQATEEIREAVFSREENRDIPVDLQTEFFDAGGQNFELTVSSRLDVKDLKFRKAEDRNNDTLTVVTGLFDPNGNYVAGIQRVVGLHLRDQTLQAVRNTGINVKESFKVPPGRYIVRVVVRDAEGKSITARNGGVEIP